MEEELEKFVSPIAVPLLTTKLATRCLTLVRRAVAVERFLKSYKKNCQQDECPELKGWNKYVKRGVHEVTKCIRKTHNSQTPGLVFFAYDVFPTDIISHLPVFCEQKNTVYAYLCSKRDLGNALRSRRPASVVMLVPPEARHRELMINKSSNAQDCREKKKSADQQGSAGDSGGVDESVTPYDEELDMQKAFDDFSRLFSKASKNIRKCHPYM